MSADDLRLQPAMPTEAEIVLLVRTVPFDDAVALVMQYGRAKLSEGKVEATVETYNRICVGMEAKPHV